MPSAELVIIDGKGHLFGRLASAVAKELLNGKRVVIVRSELVEMSGSLFRNKTKYWSFLRKRMNTNPKRGPFHHRAPSKILARAIRGMLPHTTKRGSSAFDRLQTFEGIPATFNKQRRVVVTDALRVLRLKPGRKFAILGDLSRDMGWKYQDVLAKFEESRKEKNTAWFAKSMEEKKLRQDAFAKFAEQNVEAGKLIAAAGY